jgi:hypothetical protein
MYALTVITMGVLFMTLSMAAYQKVVGSERRAPSPSPKAA